MRLLNRDLAASRFLWRLPRLSRLILTCILLSRQNQEISILIKISWSLRSIFWKCWDFLDCRGLLFESVEIESLNRESRSRVSNKTRSRQIETPRLTCSMSSSVAEESIIGGKWLTLTSLTCKAQWDAKDFVEPNWN